jgi:hypothetical protein
MAKQRRVNSVDDARDEQLQRNGIGETSGSFPASIPEFTASLVASASTVIAQPTSLPPPGTDAMPAEPKTTSSTAAASVRHMKTIEADAPTLRGGSSFGARIDQRLGFAKRTIPDRASRPASSRRRLIRSHHAEPQIAEFLSLPFLGPVRPRHSVTPCFGRLGALSRRPDIPAPSGEYKWYVNDLPDCLNHERLMVRKAGRTGPLGPEQWSGV